MSRSVTRSTIGITSKGLVLLAGILLVSATAEEAAGVGASDGVYDEAQLEHGLEVYAANCAACHGASLEGGPAAPALAPLAGHWQGEPLAALFRFASNNMPMTAPGSLEPEEYAAVVAAILHANGYPVGADALPADADELEGIVLDEPEEAPAPGAAGY